MKLRTVVSLTIDVLLVGLLIRGIAKRMKKSLSLEASFNSAPPHKNTIGEDMHKILLDNGIETEIVGEKEVKLPNGSTEKDTTALIKVLPKIYNMLRDKHGMIKGGIQIHEGIISVKSI